MVHHGHSHANGQHLRQRRPVRARSDAYPSAYRHRSHRAKDKDLPLEQRTYKGAKPTAHAKADSVRALLAAGYSKERITKELESSIAGVYRILKATA